MNNTKTNTSWDAHYISENERWVDGWRGYYSCTKDGQVISYVKDVSRVMKIRFSRKQDHGAVVFQVGDKLEEFSVTRLIYETFVRPLRKDEIVSCKNGNRKDFRLENLEIRTIAQMNADPKRLEKVRQKLYTEIILEREDGEIYYFKGFVAAMKETGISNLTTIIKKAEMAGLDYFKSKGVLYKFIVVRPERWDNYYKNAA